jgi:opacity protein-like surface antigen
MVAGALLLCAAPTAAFAAAESMVTFTLGSGTPTGSFAEIANSGAMACVNAGYRVTRSIEAGVTLGYFNYASVRNGQEYRIQDPSTGNLVGLTLSEHWTLTEIGLYGKVFPYEHGRLGTYLRAGLGAYTVRLSQDVSAADAQTNVGGNEQQNKFGFSAGLGARFRISGGTHLGVEGLYHKVYGRGRDALDTERNTAVSFTTVGATLGFGPGGK